MVGIGVGAGEGGGGVTPQSSVRVDIRSGKSYFMFCITDVMCDVCYGGNWLPQLDFGSYIHAVSYSW